MYKKFILFCGFLVVSASSFAQHTGKNTQEEPTAGKQEVINPKFYNRITFEDIDKGNQEYKNIEVRPKITFSESFKARTIDFTNDKSFYFKVTSKGIGRYVADDDTETLPYCRIDTNNSQMCPAGKCEVYNPYEKKLESKEVFVSKNALSGEVKDSLSEGNFAGYLMDDGRRQFQLDLPIEYKFKDGSTKKALALFSCVTDRPNAGATDELSIAEFQKVLQKLGIGKLELVRIEK